ncbi:type I restriction enzyme HsdR N-terminal domain-containing protein [Streptomyces sp. GXMU-J15]|uniref:Type I restriction enzyme HsdR N-terminal domain-containing protein n=1 Tax=Streptomyces fuscus TaxID=3048495 RepID=A0ABT7IVH4_9ACTN|nr:type I restriction enzyme HsdR N-terminal domain-containing protein [Streptomyces fuscus]MDL2075542.1 type I restriction enzyme HsdR N-terminal domain-containing protein [Streptomyces fuscus]
MAEVALGARVRVPWGVDEADGTVVALYGDGPSQRVVVQLDQGGEDSSTEPQTVTFRAAHVQPIEEGASKPHPGTWVEGIRYERELRKALEGVFHRIAGEGGAELASEPHTDFDTRYDMALFSKGQPMLVIEAKSTPSSSSAEAVNQLRRHLERLPRGVAGLLVSKEPLREGFAIEGDEGHPIAAVQWQSTHDNQKLARIVRKLLANTPAA